ncbi:MAG TPA: DNA polymerase III subunit delta [Nitrospiraceae bacterium]|nr:DNA polymerase III subunit delta [Nitrospiraceae bacterium]
MIKYTQLITDLKKGRILPLYLFYGEEAFLIQEAVDLIIRKVVDPGARDFTFNTVYCRETPVSDMVNLAQTLPFLSPMRLVIAKEIDVLKAADIKELLPYLESPSPSTCFVMVSEQRKYDKKAVVSAVETHGAVTAFYPLAERELHPWIAGWGRARGLSITGDAIQFLVQVLGTDLQKVNNELQKVVIYQKDKKDITLEDVMAVVGDFREFTSFDLAEAIGSKEAHRAFQILTRLLQEGEQPVGLLGMTAWNFRRLMRAKALEAGGVRYDEIKKKVGVLWLHSSSFQKQMKRFTLSELRDAFEVMLVTDKKLKSSSMKGRLVLERMIMTLCGA